MADGLRQLGQFLIGVRTLKTLKDGLRPRFRRWAAEGIGIGFWRYSHSTINDTMDVEQASSTGAGEPRPSGAVKEFKPQMNADEHRLKTGILSALICVYLRLKTFFSQLLREWFPRKSRKR
jgi:hypothetical protein